MRLNTDRLFRAIREDTGILTSLLAWIDEEQQTELKKVASRESQTSDELFRIQGAVRVLDRLKGRLKIAAKDIAA